MGASQRAWSKMAAVLLVALATEVFAGWCPIQQLTDSRDNSNLPTIGHGLAVNGSYVHVVYAGKSNNQWRIFYLRSTNRGETWEPATILDDSVEAFTFSVAADGLGGVHLVNRRPGGRLYYRRSTDNGETWFTAQELGPTAEMPILLTDRSSYVYVIDPAADGRDATLYIRRSTNGGETWQAPVPIATQSGYGGLCASAAKDGRIHVAWAFGLSGESHIYHARSTDRGATWSSAVRVSTIPRVTSYGIWAGTDNNVLLAFTRSQSPANFRFSTDGGSTWSAETTLPVLLGDCVADAYGGVHGLGVVESERVMYLRTASRGATWVDTVNISGPEPGTRSKPQIDIDELANLFAVWNSRQTGTVQVYLRRGEGVGGVKAGLLAVGRQVRLFPVPARSVVFLEGTTSCARLCDPVGCEVALLRPGRNDVSHIPSGVYFAHFDRMSGIAGPIRLINLED